MNKQLRHLVQVVLLISTTAFSVPKYENLKDEVRACSKKLCISEALASHTKPWQSMDSRVSGNDPIKEKTSFVIITASYNNIEWYERNLSSIFSQNYDNWHLVYIDDCSTDGTGDAVHAYIATQEKADQVTLIRNTQRHGHMHNQYYAINAVAANKVIVIVDGDDWLAHSEVLSYLNTRYQPGDVWLTYGQFWYWKKDKLGICRKLPDAVIQRNEIRQYPLWVTSHLRTFYAGLFHKIHKKDLMYHDAFVPMCADIAAMFPMLEMAGEHIRFIEDILYIYNDANQLSFFHDKRQEQIALRKELCSRPKYQPLKEWIN